MRRVIGVDGFGAQHQIQLCELRAFHGVLGDGPVILGHQQRRKLPLFGRKRKFALNVVSGFAGIFVSTQHQHQQPVLVLDVFEQPGLRDADAIGDLLDGHAVIAALGHHFGGGIGDRLEAFFSARSHGMSPFVRLWMVRARRPNCDMSHDSRHPGVSRIDTLESK